MLLPRRAGRRPAIERTKGNEESNDYTDYRVRGSVACIARSCAIRNKSRFDEQGMMGGAKAHYDGIVAFSQTDFTEDLEKITVPVLVMHGDDDQIVPYGDSAPLSAKLLRNSTLKTYKGFPHGMPTTNADQINTDLLAFLKGTAKAAA